MTDLDGSVVLSDAAQSLVDELRSIREAVKDLKIRESEIRDILLQELKDRSQGVTASGVPVVTVERQPRSRLDSNRLQALYQSAWKDCQIHSTVDVVRLPETI